MRFRKQSPNRIERKTMWALMLFALLPLADGANGIVDSINKHRKELADKFNITNMQTIDFSPRLDTIVQAMTCDTIKHGADYRAAVYVEKEEAASRKVRYLTKIIFKGAIGAAVNAVNKFDRVRPNYVDHFVPPQKELACRLLDCTGEYNGVSYSTSRVCLIGPVGGDKLDRSLFEIQNGKLEDHDLSYHIDKFNEDRRKMAEKYGITNMKPLIWSKTLEGMMKKRVKNCTGWPHYKSALFSLLPDEAVRKYRTFKKLPDTRKKFLALVDKMATLKPFPNLINYYDPMQKRVGCAPLECTKWTNRNYTVTDFRLACIFYGAEQTTRDSFKFDKQVTLPPQPTIPPPPKETPTEAPAPPTDAPAPQTDAPATPAPEVVVPPKQMPLKKGKEGKESEEDDGRTVEEDEDDEDSASQLSVLFLIAFVASALF